MRRSVKACTAKFRALRLVVKPVGRGFEIQRCPKVSSLVMALSLQNSVDLAFGQRHPCLFTCSLDNWTEGSLLPFSAPPQFYCTKAESKSLESLVFPCWASHRKRRLVTDDQRIPDAIANLRFFLTTKTFLLEWDTSN